MMQVIDSDRFNAFVRLLSEPDPADLPRRAHVARCQGDPDRRETRFPGILMAWLQRRHLETDGERPLAAARRVPRGVEPRWSHRGFRVLRPTG